MAALKSRAQCGIWVALFLSESSKVVFPVSATSISPASLRFEQIREFCVLGGRGREDKGDHYGGRRKAKTNLCCGYNRETNTRQAVSKALCIDCLAGLDSLPDKSVACVVTSPPYNIGVKYGTHDDNRADYPEWMKSVFVGIKRVLTDDGHFFLQVGGIAKSPTIPWLVLSMALAAGFVIQNQIIWAKNVTVDGRTATSSR